jgi:hypothetical protein
MQPTGQAEQEREQELGDTFFVPKIFQYFTKRNVIILVLAIQLIIAFSILAPKFFETMSLTSTNCTIKNKSIEKKICKTQECRGKGRKTKCKSVSYDCFHSNILVEADSKQYNVTSKLPVKLHDDVQSVLNSYAIDSIVPCYSKGNSVSFESPSFGKEIVFCLVFLVLGIVVTQSIFFYIEKGQGYKYKNGFSKKDLKKSINKLKVKMN